MSEISESAKAVQEVAKVADTAIATGRDVGSFVAKLIGEPLEVASGMVADRLKFARAERLLRLLTRFEDKIKQPGIKRTFRKVSPKLVLPILEHASLEDDDELQDLWANLLSSAIDPSFDGSIRAAYVDILRQLEVIDVHILQSIYRLYRERQRPATELNPAAWVYGMSADSPTVLAIDSAEIIEGLKIKPTVFENSIDNLMRLRCIASFVETKYVQSDGGRQMFEMYDHVSFDHLYDRICMTAFGVNFVEACLGKTDLSTRPVWETTI